MENHALILAFFEYIELGRTVLPIFERNCGYENRGPFGSISKLWPGLMKIGLTAEHFKIFLNLNLGLENSAAQNFGSVKIW